MKKKLYLLTLLFTQFTHAQSMFNKFVYDICLNPKVAIASVAGKVAFGYTVTKYFEHKAKKSEAELATQLQIAENQMRGITLEKLRQRNIALKSSAATTLLIGSIWAISTYKDNIMQWFKNPNNQSQGFKYESNELNEILQKAKTIPDAIQSLKKHGYTKKNLASRRVYIDNSSMIKFTTKELQQIIFSL